jgi:hypothetical protein
LKDNPKGTDPKKGQQPNLKLDQHKLTKTTREAILMKSSKRSNQEPTTVNYRNRGKAEKDKKKKHRPANEKPAKKGTTRSIE